MTRPWACPLCGWTATQPDQAWHHGRTQHPAETPRHATVADMRFAKPLDEDLIRRLLTTHEVAVTVEEASIGGFGAHVLTMASDEGLIDAGLKLRTMRLPDIFQDHDAPMRQYDEAGLNAPHIVETVLKALRRNDIGVDNDAGAIA